MHVIWYEEINVYELKLSNLSNFQKEWAKFTVFVLNIYGSPM
jgi:hypothetical protein